MEVGIGTTLNEESDDGNEVGKGGDRYHPASPAMTVQRTRLFVTMRSIQGKILISIICKRLLLTDIGDLSQV